MALAGTLDGDRPPLPFDQVANEREADAESFVDACRGRVLVRERLEHVRQKLAVDALAGVLERSSTTPSVRDSETVTWPPMGVNLIAFETRFEAI